MPSLISPPVSSTRPARLWEMEEYQFQDFCQALCLSEVDECFPYGVRGQAQFGADLLIYDDEERNNGIGQCKCYKVLTAGDVKEAATKFYRNWTGRWKRFKIVRFILMTACSSADANVQEEIRRQKTRFRRINVKFEIWDDGRLISKVRSHPELVRRFLGDEWVPLLCTEGGLKSGAATPSANAPAIDALFSLMGPVVGELGEAKEAELEQIRELLRRGQTIEGRKKLAAVRQGRAWDVLAPKIRGRVLRLQASLALDHDDDLARAASLLEEAHAADPDGDFRVVEAVMRHRRTGVEAALAALGAIDNVDIYNLRLALLLNQGKASEVLELLQRADFEPAAETWRLHATAALLLRRPLEAQKAAARSAALAPDWSLVRLTCAMVDYCTSVNPVFHAWTQLEWPVPAEWPLVYTDATTLAGLERAAASFQRLIDELPSDSRGQTHIYETWRLACLANDPTRREAAVGYAQTLLKQNPAHFRAAIWALERGYDFDRGQVRAAVEKLLEEADPPQGAILCAASLQLAGNDLPSAEATLRKYRSLFEQRGTESVWRLTLAQVLANEGKDAEAQELARAEQNPGMRRFLETTLARIAVRMGGAPRAFADRLAQVYEETHGAEELFDCCEAKMVAREAEWVADHAEELLRKLPTTAAVRLALAGAWQSSRFELCLSLLRDHGRLFPSGKLPADLRRMEVIVLQKTGHLSEAVHLADEQLANTSEVDDLLTQFNAHLAVGDLRGCAHVAQRMLGDQRIKGAQLLQAARPISAYDHALAVHLWHEAVRRGQDQDPIVLGAVALANQLGLQKHAGELVQRLPQLATSGGAPVRVLTYEELVAMLQAAAKRREQLNANYSAGISPIHLLAAMESHPLADLYHGQLEQNRRADTFLRRVPLLVRHGSRELPDDLELSRGQLVVDITALLLAADLQILDAVEANYAPLWIPSHLPVSLLAQLQQITPGDEEGDASRRAVLQAVTDDQIQLDKAKPAGPSRDDEVGRLMGAEWCQLFEKVKAADGLLVESLPLASRDEKFSVVTFPGDEASSVVSLGELLTALSRNGQISGEELHRCTEQFGNLSHPSARALDVPRHKTVFVGGRALVGLARAGVLSKIAAYCRLTITPEEHARLDAETREHSRRTELSKWVTALLDRVRKGLNDGTYQTFAATAPLPTEEGEQHPDELCLHDLVSTTITEGRKVWCDDRFISGYRKAGKGLLIGINEVLRDLRRKTAMTDDAYFDSLLSLRAGNVRFLPVSQEEIFHHVRRAAVVGGELAETPALAVLRRSVAACLLDEGRVQRPSLAHLEKGLLGELTWFKTLTVACVQATVQLWREENVENPEARADWILANLHVNTNTMSETFLNGRADEQSSVMLAHDIAAFFGIGLSLPSESPFKPHSLDSPRYRFYRWVEARLLEPNRKTNPEILPPIGKSLSDALAQPLWQGLRGKKRQRALRLHMLGAALELPPDVLHEIELPPSMREEFGVVVHEPSTEMLGHRFDRQDFWSAVAAAVNERTASITDVTGKYTFDLGPTSPPQRTAISLTGADLEQTGQVTGKLWPALVDDRPERRRFLQSCPELFDCAATERDAAIDRLVLSDDPRQCMDEIDRWRERSAEWFYRRVFRRLQEGGEHEINSFLPPSAEGLASHLRLDGDEPDWERCAARLLADEGLETALFRFACLPRTIPQVLRDAVRAETSERIDPVFERLRTQCLSPLMRLHLFALLVERATVDPAALEIARSMKADIVSGPACKESYPGFHAILRWTFRWFQRWPEMIARDTAQQLALGWLHAVRLHDTLLLGGVSNEVIHRHFFAAEQQLHPGLAREDFQLNQDVAAPPVTNWPLLLGRHWGDTLGRVSGEIGSGLRLTADELIGPPDDKPNRNAAWLRLMGETDLRPNRLGSFLGGEWEPPLRAALGENTFGEIFATRPREEIEKALATLEKDPSAHVAWAVLWAVLGEGPIYPHLVPRLESILPCTDISSTIIEVAERAELVKPSAVCSLTSHLASDELRQRFERQLLECARGCHGKYAGISQAFAEDDPVREAGAHLLQAALLLTRQNDQSVSSVNLFRLARQMVEAWPVLGTLMRTLTGATVPALPLAQSQGAWPFYLALRAAP